MDKRLVKLALAEYAEHHLPPAPQLKSILREQIGPREPSTSGLPTSAPELHDAHHKHWRDSDRAWAPIRSWSLASLATVLLLSVGLILLVAKPTTDAITTPATDAGSTLPTPLAATAQQSTTSVDLPSAQEDEALSEVFRTSPMFSHIENSNLAERTNLRQTTNGYTMAVKMLYADANMVAIGYTLKGPQTEHVNATGTLVDSTGTTLPFVFAVNSPYVSGLSAHAVVYDLAALHILPAQLKLHLVLDLSKASVAAQAPASGPNTSGEVPSESSGTRPNPVTGPFEFDFTAPVRNVASEGHISAEHRTARAANMSLTLERVIVTPGMTQAILSVSPPTTKPIWAQVAASVAPTTTAGPQTKTADVQAFRWLGNNRYSYVFPSGMMDSPGEWNLIISSLFGWDAGGNSVRSTGPWEFNFSITPGLR